MAVTYGSKRTVVGAHYGWRDFVVQRITAILLLAQVLLSKGPIGYDTWAGIFATQWMRVLAFSVILALAWHAWVGVRDILMDYVHATGMRLLMQMLTIVWLVGCAGWALQVLWRL